MFRHGPHVVLGTLLGCTWGPEVGEAPLWLERCPGKDEISVQ